MNSSAPSRAPFALDCAPRMASVLLAAFWVMLLLPLTTTADVGGFSEGFDYERLDTPLSSSGDSVEVLEFFFYGCPHCYRFEPVVEHFKRSKASYVTFRQVPAIFAPNWEPWARAFYALEELGELDRLHPIIFRTLHIERQRIYSRDEIINYLASKGIDRKAFVNAYDYSFSVDSQVREAKRLTKASGIEGVPAVVIAGKYRTSGSLAGSYRRVLEVMNGLSAAEYAEIRSGF